MLAWSAPLPSVSRSVGSTWGRKAVSARVKKTVPTPTSRQTTTSWATLSQPSHQASGMVPSSAARARSVTTMTGRRGHLSTHTPAGSATTSQASEPAAEIRPSSKAEACRTRTATRGRARKVTELPSSLAVSPDHNRVKSRCRNTLAMPGG
jgi:hypothetical protein